MPDGRALQAGTSHNLGQGFGKAFGISFLGKDSQPHVPWQNSWGFSTRLIGALIMTHGDDKGVVIPPAVAQYQAVIVPILFDKTKEVVLKECKALESTLVKAGLRVMLDDRDEHSSGWKFNDWELKGVPLRIELGPKDLEKRQVVLVRRHDGKKKPASIDNLAQVVRQELDQIQKELFEKAKKFLDESIIQVNTKQQFLDALEKRKLVLAPFCMERDVEDEIKAATGGVTTRCIPLDAPEPKGQKCVWTGKPAKAMIYFAKSY
jgi:prolyl-tRNA synthetase